MKDLFERFLREKTYLTNISENTVRSYRQAFKHFEKHSLDKSGVNEFVIGMRQQGLSVGGCNVYIRSINSFLSWCHEQGYEHLKVKQLKEEKKVIQTFSEDQLKIIYRYKTQGFAEWRCQTILILIMDTGVRIEEALSLKTESVDLNSLVITVTGKGNKQRVVPISVECRKTLFRFMRKHPGKYAFPVRDDGRMGYHNFRRDMVNLCTKVGIKGVRISPHTLRHTFAKNYIRAGGNVFYLQAVLGHETLQVTKRYVDVETEALKEAHIKTSLLNRLR
ncbi:MAG: integrase/recombinase XerD [Acidobacteriota bacterium]|nr:integrase/recombinase XerD [Acidobacteriota bacterium]